MNNPIPGKRKQRRKLVKSRVSRGTGQLIIPGIANNEEPEINSNTVKSIISECKLDFSEETSAQIIDYALLVKTFNDDINLVSRSDVNRVILHSLFECLSLVPHLPETDSNECLDVGSGGGFPGMVLAIARPDLNWTLLDSRRAKILALKGILNELSLENVTIVHDRAEIFSDHSDTRYGIITAKSVGILREILDWVEPLFDEKSYYITWKGPEGLREYNKLTPGSFTLSKRIPVLLHRSIFILEKESGDKASTPAE